MEDKQKIEVHVSKLFLERKTGSTIDQCELVFGDPEKGEPDILHGDMGIEIGAVLKGTNTHIDVYEQQFLTAASENIEGKIPPAFQIRLAMQDDSETVEHRPTPAFKSYNYLPKYLDGIFVYQYGQSTNHQKVVLNQKSKMRTLTFPNNTKGRKFLRFMDELSKYINSLSHTDFTPHNGHSMHHCVVTDGTVVKTQNPLDKFISCKIIDKLSKNKYSGDYSKQILLLHNYSILGNTEFTSDIHFYSHHRNDIFNLIHDHIISNNSFRFYSGIFFLDFSLYARNNNYELIDFTGYTLKEPSEFLHGYDEIRFDLRNSIIRGPKGK